MATDNQMGLGFHHLRHFYRANLRKLRVNPEDQKNAMRHARIATTMDIYGNDEDARAEDVRPVNAQVVEILPKVEVPQSWTKAGPNRKRSA